ncbi:MAG: tetratricopeptide repeat protein [Myxococcota bacterium]
MSEVTVFVLMPFGDEFDDVSMIIKDAVRAVKEQTGLQIRCSRADDISKPGRITDSIIEAIQTCTLLVADITGSNPNVMYELGYGHALRKPAIVLNQAVHDSPFDVKDHRQILYGRNKLVKECRPSLIAALKDFFADGDWDADFQPSPAERGSASGEVSRNAEATTPVRPGRTLIAELQRLHLQMKVANSRNDRAECRRLGDAVNSLLSRITVVSSGDEQYARNTAAALGNCAVELELSEQPDLAEDIYRKTLGLFPDYAGVHVQYADYLIDAGQFNDAQIEISRARELDPADERIQAVEMKLAARTGVGSPDVQTQVRELFEEDPGDRHRAAAYLTLLHQLGADLEEFERACCKWKKFAPEAEKVDADRALADFLANTGVSANHERALEMYGELLSNGEMSEEERHDILHNAATLHDGLGRREEARALWKEAYEMDRRDPSVMASFSQRLASWGELEAAVAVASGDPLPDSEGTEGSDD